MSGVGQPDGAALHGQNLSKLELRCGAPCGKVSAFHLIPHTRTNAGAIIYQHRNFLHIRGMTCKHGIVGYAAYRKACDHAMAAYTDNGCHMS